MDSHRTALHRNTISAPMKWLNDRGLLGQGDLLDYGCGHGFDADTFGMEKWDPHWWPKTPDGYFDQIFCTYVLNVTTYSTQAEVLNNVTYLLKPDGEAFFAVRRDLPREGYVTKCGRHQRYVTLPWLNLLVDNSKFAIYCGKKGELNEMVEKEGVSL